MNFRKIRKFRRNIRAISPIIATLLLIAIAVVAALVTYAWVMGYIGFQTGNAGKSVQVTSVSDNAGQDPYTAPTKIIVYVQSSGSPGSTVAFSAASGYVNGTLWTTTETAPSTTFAPLVSGATATLTLTNTGVTLSSGEQVTVKITTTSGTYSQVTTNLP